MATLVVKSAVVEYLKKKEARVSTAFYDALDKRVQQLLDAAAERAKANKRSTVLPQDA